MSAPPALAAEPDTTQQSEALAQVIVADVLDIGDEETLAALGTSRTGFPDAAGPEANPTDLSLVGTDVLSIPELDVPLISQQGAPGLLELGEAGLLSSYGTSQDATSSTASAGVIGEDGSIQVDPGGEGEFNSASVNLTNLFDQINVDQLTDQIVDEASLELGALGSTATATGGADPKFSSEYAIADAELVISSPTVGAVGETLDTTIIGVGDTLDMAVGAEGALGQVSSSLEGLDLSLDLGIPGVSALGLAVDSSTVQVENLDTALAEASDQLINEPLVSNDGLVSIDLATGDITVDLEQLVEGGLNGQPANTEVLNGEMAGLITQGVTEALGSLTTKVGEVLTPIVNDAEVTIDLGLSGGIPVVLNADVTAQVQTTLGQLAGSDDTEPTVEVGGNVEIIGGLIDVSIDDLVDPLTDVLVPELLNTAQPLVSGLVDGITTGLTENLNTVIDPLVAEGSVLDAVLDGLIQQLVSVTVNEQPEPGYLGAESFTVNALSLELLPQAQGGVIDLDLASSAVRAADEVIDPAITLDPGTVEDGATTTVTGESYPPNTDVDVQLVDPDGNAVGDPVPVTTDADGNFTTELTVPAGTTAGDFDVVGTATSGEEATAPLVVTNADEPTDDNTADNTEVNTEVNTDVNTADNAGDNTDANTEVNTADNAGDNTDVNTDVNTTDNAGDNTDVNTEVNTTDNAAENTEVNTADNTGDNTDVNTEVNMADNAGDNTDVNTEVNTTDNAGDNTDVNTDVNTTDNAGDNTDVNTEVNSADNTAENTEVNTADNAGDNTDANTDVNTADNAGDNTDANTEVNTADNAGDNTDANTEVNTTDNTGDNTSDNTSDNTAHPDINLTPKRAVQGVDDVLVNGTGYTPNATAEAYLKATDGDVLGSAEPMQKLATAVTTLAAIADPGESIGTVDVDENGEVTFRVDSSELDLGDYVVTVTDNEEPFLGDNELFTVVPQDDSTADNTAENTEANTEVNTADNEGDNTEANTEVNAADNAAENTEANTEVNTEVNAAENTEANTEVNTADNAAENTEVNTADNAGDNTGDDGATDLAVTVDPETVEDGESTTVIGEGYTPDTEVEVQLTDPEGNAIGDPVNVTTDENGEFSTDITVPEGTDAGDYIVDATDESGESASADLAVTNGDDGTGDDGTTEPGVTVDPGAVDPGESTTVTGEDFPPNTEVEVQLTDPEGNVVGDPVTVTTDDDGNFTADITVPEGSAPGDYTVDAAAETGESASADLTVNEAPGAGNGSDNSSDNAAANGAGNTSDNTSGGNSGWTGGNGSSSNGSGNLAQTGATGTAAIVGLAALLLLAGGAGVVVARRAGR